MVFLTFSIQEMFTLVFILHACQYTEGSDQTSLSMEIKWGQKQSVLGWDATR